MFPKIEPHTPLDWVRQLGFFVRIGTTSLDIADHGFLD